VGGSQGFENQHDCNHYQIHPCKIWSLGENPLRCITQDEKGLVLIAIIFTLYFDPHKK
jgi:hypothetical protein